MTEDIEGIDELLGRPVGTPIKTADGRIIVVNSDNGIVAEYDAVKLATNWYKMSTITFFKLYGFNWTPDYDLQKKVRKLRRRGGLIGCKK